MFRKFVVIAILASALVWCVVYLEMRLFPDPQNGLFLMFSPLFAATIGFGSSIVYTSFALDERDGKQFLFWCGLTLVVIPSMWYIGELLQQFRVW